MNTFRNKVPPRLAHAACIAALGLASLTAAAVVPSTLRALHDSYQALSVGTNTFMAIELMGNPKTRSDSTMLGISYSEMTWVDIAQMRYQAKFVADHLVQKSASAID